MRPKSLLNSKRAKVALFSHLSAEIRAQKKRAACVFSKLLPFYLIFGIWNFFFAVFAVLKIRFSIDPSRLISFSEKLIICLGKLGVAHKDYRANHNDDGADHAEYGDNKRGNRNTVEIPEAHS